MTKEDLIQEIKPEIQKLSGSVQTARLLDSIEGLTIEDVRSSVATIKTGTAGRAFAKNVILAKIDAFVEDLDENGDDSDNDVDITKALADAETVKSKLDIETITAIKTEASDEEE